MIEYIDSMYKGIGHTGFTKHYLTLFSIVEGLETKSSFEFGTGISTKVIIDALRITGGKHTSCDIRDIEDTGLDLIYLVDNADTWTYIQRDSREINFKAYGMFDFVLHDGSHIPEVVKQDLNNIFPLIKNDGIILVHDTIFVPELEEICKELTKETDSTILTLPYGYGLSLIKVNNKDTKERVSPIWKKF